MGLPLRFIITWLFVSCTLCVCDCVRSPSAFERNGMTSDRLFVIVGLSIWWHITNMMKNNKYNPIVRTIKFLQVSQRKSQNDKIVSTMASKHRQICWFFFLFLSYKIININSMLNHRSYWMFSMYFLVKRRTSVVWLYAIVLTLSNDFSSFCLAHEPQ